jgi:hypothetical protein
MKGMETDSDATAGADWSGCSDDQLEAQICGAAARVAAATCRFLAMVGEYDARGAWQAWECHDMAGWLSWKCAISPVTAREHVRVARNLRQFALLREQFAAGKLSYSQTRAIARVATEHTEAQLVELAAAMTAAQLETVTRAYRRASTTTAETARDRHLRRRLSYHQDDDGNLVGQFCLPAEQGCLLEAAIAALVEHAEVDAADRDGARDPLGAVRADALMDLITRATATSDDTAGDDPYLVTIIADTAILADQSDRDGLCQVAGGPGLAAETVRRLTCDATTVTVLEGPDGNLIDAGRQARRPNRRLRRALRHRDGHCQFPGCTRTRTHAHHLVHWAQGGPTTLDNMTLLCSRHHHRLHEGGYRLERTPTGQLRYYRPDGQPIPAVVAPGAITPVDRNSEPVPDPYHSDWDGSRLDLPYIIDGLLQADGRLQHPVLTPV